MLGLAISSALKRANVGADEVEDVVMGCAMQQGTTGTTSRARRLSGQGFPSR